MKKLFEYIFGEKVDRHLIDIVNNTYKSLQLNERGGTSIDTRELYSDPEFIRKVEEARKALGFSGQ